MLSTYLRLLELFDDQERRRFRLLLGLILVMGLLDMVGVAAIFPFLALLSDPASIETNGFLVGLNDVLHFSDTQSFLLFLGCLTFFLVVVGQAVKALTIFSLTRFSKMREYSIGSRLLDAYLRQPYAASLGRHSSDMASKVLSEVGKVVEGVMLPALRVLAQSVLVILLGALLLLVDPLAALATAVGVGASYGLVFVLVRRYLTRIGHDRLQANTERYRAVQEAMGGFKEVKLFGVEDTYLQRFRGPARRFALHQSAVMAITEMPRYLLEAIVFGGMILLLMVLMARADGRLDEALPVIGVFAFAGARLFPALQQIYNGVAMIRFHRPSLEALHHDLAMARELAQHPLPADAAPMPIRDRIELKRISYAYPDVERPALQGLDLVIAANTTVGIVGATGAGKTTAVDIILGLLEPQEGQILVDGVPVDGSNRRAWQRSIGYVPQSIFLIDDTVAANIALGVPPEAMDMAAVERAARVAELHSFVTEELAEGYASHVGERGVRLSGGQRQRIGIARALYRDPDVLVFDEATSALDNLTERALMDAIHNLARKKTIILIAHRLSTVQDCDMIFVLERGRCRTTGRYEQLMKDDGAFRRLALAAQ